MATATPTRPNPAAAPRDAAVERAISAAANKLRTNDVATGAAAAAVVLLGYLAVMITLDRLFTLPDWVRLLGLVGLLGGLVAVAWFLIVRPMRRRVNPRYVARKIEQTLPDAKNVLINWVDLQDEQLPGSVKTAVGANAAAGMADADVDTATSSKPVIWLGSAAGILVLVLAVLFLVFSGPQFLSLVQRAVVPFKPAEIASATTIQIDEPKDAAGNVTPDVTVTDGQPLTIAVTLSGRLPNPDGPDKTRLLVRYSQDSTDVIELPMTPAGRSDEFRIDLGRGTILNGFWYRVAAADARTPEYQVTVRTRPMLSDFVAEYDYPAYLKWPKDTEKGPNLSAIRGTTVTLTAKANRPVQSATLAFAGVKNSRGRIPGEVSGDGRDRVKFTLKLEETGTYRVEFKPSGPEVSTSTADYPITVSADAAPEVEIVAPAEKEIELPLNGLLAVDGKAKDDHGITGMELRFKVVGRDGLTVKAKPLGNADEFLRQKDGTYLTDVPDYKDSVKLDTLTTADGKLVVLTETDVLEYWIAAIDNCTEPAANEGESARQRVRLLPAVKEPEKKQEQAKKEQERKEDERKAEAKRDEQRKNETRPEEQARNPDKDPQQQPKGENPDGSKPNEQPMDGKGEKPPEGTKPDGGEGTPPEDKDLQKKADELKEKLEQQKRQQKQEAGDARGDGDKSEGTETKPEANTKPPEDPKGQPNGDGAKGAAERKGGPKPEDMTKPEGDPSQGKDGGKLVDPQRSEEKQPPNEGAKGDQQPTGDTPKDAPKEGAEAGSSKESKEPPQPKPGDPKPQDGKKDGQAGDARGTEPQPQQGEKPQDPNDPMAGGGNTEKKVDPNDLGNSKPNGDPTRGDTKPEPKGGEKTEQPKDAGGAKGEAPTKPAESKDPPKGGENQPMEKKGPPADATQEKPQPKEGADGKAEPSEGKGEGPKPTKPMDGGKEEEKGTAKPSDVKKPDGTGKPEEKNQPGGSGEKPQDPKTQPQGSGNDKKLDQKEMEKAVQNLDSKDPKEKKDAQDKLDQAVGKENREKIEQMKKDLQSDDKAKRDAAKQKLEEMKKEAQKNAGGGQQQPKEPKELTEQEKKELLDAAKNLDSKDPKEKKDAQDKLDKAMGKENREKLEQMQKDLKSDNKETRAAAEKKLEEMAKDAQKNAGAQKPKELTEQEKKDLIEAAKNLDSKDEKTKKDAQDKLDKAMGKENRQKLEQMNKDLKSDDKAKREAAEKELQEMAKKAQEGQKDTTAQKPPEMTEQQKKELADAAEDLNSKDEAKRKAAEQKLDEAIGKEKRQELQQDLKDLQGNDPAKAEQARKKLEQQLEQAKKNQENTNSGQHENKPDGLGGGNLKKPGETLKANLENQLKSRELALDDFKKYQGDKKFLKENNWTEEEYNRFLKQEEAAVRKLRDQVDNARINPPTPGAGGRPTVGRNEFKKVETRGTAGNVGGSNTTGVAPPGFGEAVKRFNGEASKQK